MHWMANFMIFAFFSSPNGQQFQKPYFDSNTIIDDEKDSISVDSVDSSDIPEMSPSELQEQSSGLPIYENPFARSLLGNIARTGHASTPQATDQITTPVQASMVIQTTTENSPSNTVDKNKCSALVKSNLQMAFPKTSSPNLELFLKAKNQMLWSDLIRNCEQNNGKYMELSKNEMDDNRKNFAINYQVIVETFKL